MNHTFRIIKVIFDQGTALTGMPIYRLLANFVTMVTVASRLCYVLLQCQLSATQYNVTSLSVDNGTWIKAHT